MNSVKSARRENRKYPNRIRLILVATLVRVRPSVSDPDSLNPDPDPAKNLNPDPGKFVTPTKNFMNFFFTSDTGNPLKNNCW